MWRLIFEKINKYVNLCMSFQDKLRKIIAINRQMNARNIEDIFIANVYCRYVYIYTCV